MSNFEQNGFRTIRYDVSASLIKDLRSDLKAFTADIPPCPGTFEGRGIVMCIGGFSYYTCGLIAIRMLRQSGCMLPVEVWYKGNELSAEVMAELSSYEVRCCDFNSIPHTGLSGVALKPLAILHSRFREVFFLDADNICLKDPAAFFLWPAYQEHGAVFWPDYWKTPADNPIWKIIRRPYADQHEQESGQLLVDKERCWRELQVCVYLNRLGHIYHKLLFGDKDTFRFAWMALKSPFYMIPSPVIPCGYMDDGCFLGTTMVQHDPEGGMLLLHRNLLKWDITTPQERSWMVLKRFRDGAQQRRYVLGRSAKGHQYIDLEGDVYTEDTPPVFREAEESCLTHLADIRSSPAYIRFAMHTYFASKRYAGGEAFSLVSW
ncbi:hypothetical protein [Chitinophaga solisilvae]|uniref:hypothetical protein n=1 Tax=Chitinophaga solisilvae TaxID=1233460 RepID=UPI00136B7BE5|nr:hypothetical protein [Chitinophaga solisilvae]